MGQPRPRICVAPEWRVKAYGGSPPPVDQPTLEDSSPLNTCSPGDSGGGSGGIGRENSFGSESGGDDGGGADGGDTGNEGGGGNGGGKGGGEGRGGVLDRAAAVALRPDGTVKVMAFSNEAWSKGSDGALLWLQLIIKSPRAACTNAT